MSESTRSTPGIPPTQFTARPGIVDLGPGYLDPSLLPVDLIRDALEAALERHGPDALGYGANRGPALLRSLLAERVARGEGFACREENVLITAGTSQTLHYLASTETRPGEVVLVEDPSYDLGCNIFRRCGLDVLPIRCDDHGIAVDALQAAIDRERRVGRRIAFLYLIPTFHNPTGRVMTLDRRLAVLAVAAAGDVTIIEDVAYRELGFERPLPSSLLALSEGGDVIQVASFSKSLAPGLRLGWITTDAGRVQRIGGEPLLMSGGGLNHLIALAVCELYASGAADQHLITLRHGLRERRDALAEALWQTMPAAIEVNVPDGGFFTWIRLPRGLAAERLLSTAEQAGVSFALGRRFGAAGAQAIRVAFSFHPPPTLGRAGARLGELCRQLLGRSAARR